MDSLKSKKGFVIYVFFCLIIKIKSILILYKMWIYYKKKQFSFLNHQVILGLYPQSPHFILKERLSLLFLYSNKYLLLFLF